MAALRQALGLVCGVLSACTPASPTLFETRPPVARPKALDAPATHPGTAVVPTPTPPGAPKSELQEVVSSVLPDLEVSAFDGGAVVAARSLLLVIEGDTVRQEARHLQALPEWINWDASVYLGPVFRGPARRGDLPDGLELSAHAGNRHGPDFEAWWAKGGWSTLRPRSDPRLSSLPRAQPYTDATLRVFASGELIVVRYGHELESFYFASRSARPVRVTNDAVAVGTRHDLVGTKGSDAFLCESGAGIAHFDGRAWEAIDTTAFVPASCAVTSDGALWVTSERRGTEPSHLWRRNEKGFQEVGLPPGFDASRVAAAGDRVWVVGRHANAQRSSLLSNRGVVAPIRVEEHQLPGPLWVSGITGLDVTSVDVASVSAAPAGPGTAACGSLAVWLGTGSRDTLLAALGDAPLRLVQVDGTKPGQVALVPGSGAQMFVVPSRQKRRALAALVESYDAGKALVDRVEKALPSAGARLLCAEPRVVR